MQLDGVQIHPTAEINVKELSIGAGSIIGPGVVIEGQCVIIGREAWLDRGAYIGGGSAFDPQAELVVGDWLHMGRNSHINCARPVSIGHEFGCGVETKVFAHGAYLSELAGFPVQFAGVTIGNRVWMPNAWVNPGVTIGSDVVVAARSLVNRDLPSGCLAGGIPVKVLQEHCYPQALPRQTQILIVERIVEEAASILEPRHVTVTAKSGRLMVYVQAGDEGDTEVFDLDGHAIFGPVSAFGRVLKNQLRRHGIRFRYGEVDGAWQPWEAKA
jgi:acetyltransferase-like isoleucine patch superfamily enzyme